MVAALQSKLGTLISDATADKKTMERLREERHQVTVQRDDNDAGLAGKCRCHKRYINKNIMLPAVVEHN